MHLHRKMPDIEPLIGKHKPHVFALGEANILKEHDLDDVKIKNYEDDGLVCENVYDKNEHDWYWSDNAICFNESEFRMEFFVDFSGSTIFS